MNDFSRLSKWVKSMYEIDIEQASLTQIHFAIQNICEEDGIELEEEEIIFIT